MTLPDERWRAVNQAHRFINQIWEDHPEYRDRIRRVLKHFPGEHDVLDAYTRETGEVITSDLRSRIGGAMWDRSQRVIPTPEFLTHSPGVREAMTRRPESFLWIHSIYNSGDDTDLLAEVNDLYETYRHPTMFATVCVLRKSDEPI